MGVIGLDVELGVELVIDGLDDLARPVEHATDRVGRLAALVAAGHGEQADVPLFPQVGGDGSADGRLVAQGVQIGVLRQELRADRQVAEVGRGCNGAKRRGRSPGSPRPG